jgi:hypothetical protein
MDRSVEIFGRSKCCAPGGERSRGEELRPSCGRADDGGFVLVGLRPSRASERRDSRLRRGRHGLRRGVESQLAACPAVTSSRTFEGLRSACAGRIAEASQSLRAQARRCESGENLAGRTFPSIRHQAARPAHPTRTARRAGCPRFQARRRGDCRVAAVGGRGSVAHLRGSRLGRSHPPCGWGRDAAVARQRCSMATTVQKHAAPLSLPARTESLRPP